MPPVAGFIGAIVTGITSAISAVTGAIGAIGSFASIGAFLTSPLGALVLGIGLQLILGPLLAKKAQAPSMDAARINVRIAEPERWDSAGETRNGGGVIFGEFDADGNFWYITIHSDSLVKNLSTDVIQRYFDDVPITINGDKDVTTNEFCLTPEGEAYDGTGTRVPYFRLWTTTYSASDPTPPAIAELQTAFPGVDGWTEDHKLVGTTYTVVRIKPVKPENRYKIFRWRGVIGIGEPNLSMVAKWAVCYDPRDGTQTLGSPSTYKFTKNPVLIWAWFRTLKYGRNKSINSINWTRIGEQATICDTLVDSLDGSRPRYECHVSFPESKERSDCEQEILISCDGHIVFDEDGKCWARAGYYYAPTLSLYRNRDIVAMETVEAQNGESETQGVIVRYTDPAAKYVAQPAAAWLNPLYYVPGETAKYLTINALSIQNHGQAMTIAKAYGMRSQPLHKALPTVGLRGLKARHERIINMQYDNTYSGEYEISTQVEVDPVGAFCGFGVVPVDPDRWTLLEGEERTKPVFTVLPNLTTLELPTGVTVTHVDSYLRVIFDPSPREDVTYEFEYKLSTDSTYIAMTVDMENDVAYSGGVLNDKSYNVRYRARLTSGKVTEWIDPVLTVSTLLDAVAPLALNSFTTPAGIKLGNTSFSIVTAPDTHRTHIAIYRVPASGTLNRTTHRVALLVSNDVSATVPHVDGDATRLNIANNYDFTSDTAWTKGAGWSIASGLATKIVSAGASFLTQNQILSNGKTYVYTVNVTALGGSGNFYVRLFAPLSANYVTGLNLTTPVISGGELIANSFSNAIGVAASDSRTVSIDWLILYEKTDACIDRGSYDYYAEALNISGLHGPTSLISGVVIY